MSLKLVFLIIFFSGYVHAGYPANKEKNYGLQAVNSLLQKIFSVWTHPTSLSDHFSPAGSIVSVPQVAMNANGDTIVAWQQVNGVSYPAEAQIFMSEYRGGVWTHPSSLSDHISLGTTGSREPVVAISDSGDSIIVWKQFAAVSSNIFQLYKSEYRGGVWTHPTSLSDHFSPAGSIVSVPQVAMNANGDTIVAWQQVNGVSYPAEAQIFMSEYRGGVWTHPSSLSDHISLGTTGSREPVVAISDSGDSIIVWKQFAAVSSNIFQLYKSEYRGGVWTHPTSLSDHFSPAGSIVSVPQVAMNANGDTIVAWQQVNGVSYPAEAQIFMSEYRGGVWTHPSSLSDHISLGTTGSREPVVAISDSGDSIIVWKQFAAVSSNIFQLYKSEYRGGVWTHPTSLSDHFSPAGSIVSVPQVAMNANGDTIVAWQQVNGVSYPAEAQIFMSEYRGGVWTHPSSLSDHISLGTTGSREPVVAISDSGDSIIVWKQFAAVSSNIFQLYKSEYR